MAAEIRSSDAKAATVTQSFNGAAADWLRRLFGRGHGKFDAVSLQWGRS